MNAHVANRCNTIQTFKTFMMKDAQKSSSQHETACATKWNRIFQNKTQGWTLIFYPLGIDWMMESERE